MNRKIYHTGYCPQIEDERTIILNIADSSTFYSGRQYVVSSFQCRDAANCSFHKNHFDGLCPLSDIPNPEPR